MNKIYVKNYEINSNKINDSLKFALISDIHFSHILSDNNLNKIKSQIDEMNVDYIFIVGDLIDCLNFVSYDDIIGRFYSWLDDLGNINNKKISVIISLGNHDFSCKKIKKFPFDNLKELYNKFILDLSKLNIHLVDNSCYVDDNIRVVGFTQPASSFSSRNSIEIEREFYDNLDNALLSFDDSKFSIALIHNPINIPDDRISKKLNNFDLILSGHMHNSLFLPFMDKLFKGNWGIIGPYKSFFPKYSRNCLGLGDDKKLIISGGITKFSYSSGIFHYFNFIFPMEIDDIVIKK